MVRLSEGGNLSCPQGSCGATKPQAGGHRVWMQINAAWGARIGLTGVVRAALEAAAADGTRAFCCRVGPTMCGS